MPNLNSIDPNFNWSPSFVRLRAELFLTCLTAFLISYYGAEYTGSSLLPLTLANVDETHIVWFLWALAAYFGVSIIAKYFAETAPLSSSKDPFEGSLTRIENIIETIRNKKHPLERGYINELCNLIQSDQNHKLIGKYEDIMRDIRRFLMFKYSPMPAHWEHLFEFLKTNNRVKHWMGEDELERELSHAKDTFKTHFQDDIGIQLNPSNDYREPMAEMKHEELFERLKDWAVIAQRNSEYSKEIADSFREWQAYIEKGVVADETGLQEQIRGSVDEMKRLRAEIQRGRKAIGWDRMWFGCYIPNFVSAMLLIASIHFAGQSDGENLSSVSALINSPLI